MPHFYRNPGDRSSYALRGSERPRCLLFAEGTAEAWFLEKWLSAAGCDPQQIAVVCFRGHGNLDIVLRALRDEENFEQITRFGFLLDAETRQPPAVVDSIRQLLQRHGIIPGSLVLSAGLPANHGDIRVVVHVSPDNTGPGFIEHTVLNEVYTHTFAPCIRALETAIVAVGLTPHPKTLVSCYIGIRQPRICGTGHGFENDLLDVMHNAYEGIRASLAHVVF